MARTAPIGCRHVPHTENRYLPGFVAPDPAVSIPGLLFLLLVVAALVAATVLRRRPAASRDAPPALPSSPDHDLQSLGLSPPRPAVARPASADTSDERAATLRDPEPRAAARTERRDEPDSSTSWSFDADAPDTAIADASRADADRARPAPARRLRAVRDTPLAPSGPAFVDPASPLWGPHEPVRHLLASFAATTGGTVAVLRLDGDVYRIDALAGQDADAPLAPLARDADGAHPLDRAPQDRMLSILDGDDLEALTYLDSDDAQTALVRALDEPPMPRVLVAATVRVAADEVDRATARLVGDYVDLLAALTLDLRDDSRGDAGEDLEAWATGTPPDDAIEGEAAADDDDAFAATPVDDDVPADLPRNVILSGEMAAARAGKRPLAFALVTLADAKSVLSGDPAGVAAAEAALEARLQAAPRVRRVEPFGDLLLGVFLDAEADQVGPWAKTLSAGDAPLFVGAVAPAAGQPDAVRAAATSALQQAYEQDVVCVMVD